MKVRIDALKAPWPSGAKVGDVVEIDSITPAFAGKGTAVGDEVEATVAFPVAQVASLSATTARAELEEEAKSLGVTFRSNTSDEVLTERIASAKAKAYAEALEAKKAEAAELGIELEEGASIEQIELLIIAKKGESA
jgi:hypothetical protein